MIQLSNFHPEYTKIMYYIVLIGSGGTGGYAVQRITKQMSAFSDVRSYLMLADPDVIEERNLLRQPFITRDLGLKKSEVLSSRYGSTYGLKIGSSAEKYIESVEELESLFSHTSYLHSQRQYIQKVLIGAVDNDFSRKIMNDYFNHSDDLVYIDAGIEGIYLPENGDKQEDEWTDTELEDHLESGYSGQVVVGLKKKGEVILQPIHGIYPIDSNDLIPPSHNCGLEPSQPQRMIANEMAALQISILMNELFASNSIRTHVINFNAQLGNSRAEAAPDVPLPIN
ncbi:ubiquitin-activating E1 family protein [Paenibacillus sonchi]|nr:ThiF family adenylyltransferase [Paenibacillus sonchi]